MRFTKKNMTIIAAAVIAAALIGAIIVCFVVLDMPPTIKYSVSLSDNGNQMISVKMTISVPLFSKKNEVPLFIGDKKVSFLSCTDSQGNIKEILVSDDDIITIPVSRGGKTMFVYDVRVAVPAKHGNRGAVTENFAVFDGDQAFLLPAEFNFYYEQGVRNSCRRIEFEFDFPEGWREIIPFRRIDNPEWMDIYAITKNAFVIGKFDQIANTPDGLKVYALPGRAPEDVSGFGSLFAYYAGLFASAPPEFSIVLLPADGPDAKIMGGSGTGVVAASFDAALLRDWQLLSHRLFHAFYDTAAPYVNVHVAPNIWLNEGLATYYENLATNALPEPLKSGLGVDVNRQMALTFDQYLYMRFKEPFMYNFAPMEEEQVDSAAMTEFLHYTVAPLIVKLIEDESSKAGNPPDALLRYCLNESAFEDQFTAFTAVIDLLGGQQGLQFCDNYLMGLEIPPLWGLKFYQPSSTEVLEALNYIEMLLANWQLAENSDYPVDLVSVDALKQAMSNVDTRWVSLFSQETELRLRDYCPEVYALIMDYYWRAKQKGFELDDRGLRFKMLQPEE